MTRETAYRLERLQVARYPRAPRAFLRDLEPALEPATVARFDDETVAELTELGIRQLMEAER